MKIVNTNQVTELYLSGESSLDIAKKIGVSKEAILYHLKKSGTPIRKPNVVDKQKVCALYNDGESTLSIGKRFGVSHTHIRRILKVNSIQMRDKKQALQKYVRWNICVICGTKFRPKSNWRDTKNTKRKTCSPECYLKFKSQYSRKDVGHSQAYYQKRRKEMKPDICEICGATDTRLDTHHKDRDHSNNSIENLMVLCANCHAKLHYNEDDRGLRGWDPKVN